MDRKRPASAFKPDLTGVSCGDAQDLFPILT